MDHETRLFGDQVLTLIIEDSYQVMYESLSTTQEMIISIQDVGRL